MEFLAPTAQLVLWFLLSLLVVTVGSNCASGFPDMDLITNRAAQIEGDSQVGMRVHSDWFYLMHNMSFNCAGNITSLILRVEIRTVTGSGQRAGISYPTISLWSIVMDDQLGQVYTKVNGSERSIVLGPSNFSTSGVIEYPLDPPIHFENGNMLGWLQQEEVVQMYLINKTDFATTAFFNPAFDVLEVTQGTTLPNDALSIYPVTDFGSSCLTGKFLSGDTIGSTFVGRIGKRKETQRVFPSIHFTCNGTITQWIIGGTIGMAKTRFLELQLWQKTRGNDYIRRNFSVIDDGFNTTTVNNVYEYSPNPPLEVQEGDILGLFQPIEYESPLAMYFQENSGPFNYGKENNVDNAFTTLTIDEPLEQNDYPLVSVILGHTEMTASSTTFSVFPSPGYEGGRSLSVSSAPNSWQSPSFTPTPTNVHGPSDNAGPDGSLSVSPSDSASVHMVSNDSALYNTVLVVAVIVGALLLVLVMVAVNVLMIVLIKRKKKSKQRIHDVLSQDGAGISSGGGTMQTELLCQFDNKQQARRREDHNNTGRLFAAGISWESQHPTTSQNNPALSTVNDTGQQVLMTSENPAYAAVDKHSQQPISQSSHAYVNVDKEDENNRHNLCIYGNIQQPTILLDDPVYFTVKDTTKKTLTLFSNPAYGTTMKDSKQASITAAQPRLLHSHRTWEHT